MKHRSHTKVLFKPNSLLLVSVVNPFHQLEPTVKPKWGNLWPSRDIPIHMDSY